MIHDVSALWRSREKWKQRTVISRTNFTTQHTCVTHHDVSLINARMTVDWAQWFSIFLSHTYCLVSEDIDSSTWVVCITIVFAFCGFLRVHFEGPIYLKLSVAQDWIWIAECGCGREDTDICAESEITCGTCAKSNYQSIKVTQIYFVFKNVIHVISQLYKSA